MFTQSEFLHLQKKFILQKTKKLGLVIFTYFRQISFKLPSPQNLEEKKVPELNFYHIYFVYSRLACI